MKQRERIRDPIHDLIGFSKDIEEDHVLWQLMQTAAIQRLRRIKQLGFSEFVYPGATHSRFSHVVGAAQMARRMLAVFERNNFFDNSLADHKLNRRATLCAALLHDIGHGPYSHVFEEIGATLNIGKSHEDLTGELIESTEIWEILQRAGVSQEVKRFFDTQTYTPYSRIISSQMDCDRLDFLCRDRYFCGLKSSYIDLEWLFDSLLIENVIIDPANQIERPTFVVQEKGLRVVEEFVVAYLKMYNDVYFHKATRGVQHMVHYIIESALKQYPEHQCIRAHRMSRFFHENAERTIDNYLNLDDSSVISFLHSVSDSSIPELSDLARRYLCRDLFKCLEIPPAENGEPRSQLLKKFVTRLKEMGVYHKVDYVKGRSYKQYDVADKKYLENILIKKDGEHIRLHNASMIIKSIPTPSTRVYFKTSDDRIIGERVLVEVAH